MDVVRYVIVRRLPGADFDEYLQADGDFGPLTDHGRKSELRRDVTRTFPEHVQALAAVKAYENKHPTTSTFLALEIRRLP